MMKKRTIISLIAWILLVALTFSSCLFVVKNPDGGEEKNNGQTNTENSENGDTPTDEPGEITEDPKEPESETYTIMPNRQSYTLVIQTGTPYQTFAGLIQTEYGVSLTVKPYALKTQETANEILFGETNRKLSADLKTAVEAEATEKGGLNWGFACRDGQFAVYATDAKIGDVSSWDKCLEMLASDYLLDTFAVTDGLFVTHHFDATEPDVPDEPDEPVEPTSYDIVPNSQNAYTVVFANTTWKTDVVNAIYNQYHLTLSASAYTAKTETKYEILVGATNRALSVKLKNAVDAKAASGGLAWGFACEGGQFAIYAKDDTKEGISAWARCLSALKTEYLSDSTFHADNNTMKIEEVTKAELDKIAADKQAASRAAKIAEINTYIASIRTENYGTVKSFTQTASVTPTVYPKANTHPRVAVNGTNIADLKKTVGTTGTATYAYGENSIPWNYIETEMTDHADYASLSFGKLAAASGDTKNYKSDKLVAIEALAFRYALEHEPGATNDQATIYGLRAVAGLLDFLRTYNVGKDSLAYRTCGYIMYISAEVYDWCYDLLTEEDKENIVSFVTSYLAVNLEVAKSATDPTPSKQGGFVGHGSEAQLLRDWLAFSIAVYDEYPQYYNYVAGRLLAEHVPSRNAYYASGNVSQGSGYGIYRYYFDMMAERLYETMQCAAAPKKLFSFDMEKVAVGIIYYLRPDETLLRIGDDENERVSGSSTPKYKMETYGKTMFMAAAFTGNTYAKYEAYSYLNHFWETGFFACDDDNSLTRVQFVMYNNPTVGKTALSTGLALGNYYGSPSGSMIARNSWDTDAAMVYMKIGEVYSANHEHNDIGSFQIYYKGNLAIDAGFYTSYSERTIGADAHNTLLVGGNGPSLSTSEPATYSNAKQVASVIGEELLYNDKGKPTYAYLAGDLTKAYTQTNETARYMLAVYNYNADGTASSTPLCFFVLDDVKTTLSKKTSFLLQSVSEPTIDGNTVTVTNTQVLNNNGKKTTFSGVLVDQAFTETGTPNITKTAVDYSSSDYNTDVTVAEIGWGHAEIASMGTAAKLLNVMYVTDTSTHASQGKLTAVRYNNDKVLGATIPALGVAAFFNKNKAEISSCTVKGDGTGTSIRYSVCGLEAGTYTVKNASGATVATVSTTAESGMITFVAAAGTYTIAKN